MDQITILTEFLRKAVFDKYNIYSADFKNDSMISEDEEFVDKFEEDPEEKNDNKSEISIKIIGGDELDKHIGEVLLQSDLEFEDKVCIKLIDNIKSSCYKRLIYYILLQDVFEYIKTRQRENEDLWECEVKTLQKLENLTLEKLIKLMDSDICFLQDILELFVEYIKERDIEDRLINRRKIESSPSIECLKKFRIYLLDDIQYHIVENSHNRQK